MSATSAALTWPSSSRSMTLKDSRMLCSSGGGSFESASLVVWRIMGGRAAARGVDVGRSVGLGGSAGLGKSAGFGVSTTVGFGGDMGVSMAFSAGFSMVISTAFSTTGVVLSRETSGGVFDLSLPPSNLAASDAVLRGRAVALVELDVLRTCSGRSARSRAGDSNCGPGDSALDGDNGSLEGDRSSRDGERRCEGEAGTSPGLAIPPVFSHDGPVCEPVLLWRGAGDDPAGVSLGLSGELVGVEGRAVEGEPCLMEPGRPKGD